MEAGARCARGRAFYSQLANTFADTILFKSANRTGQNAIRIKEFEIISTRGTFSGALTCCTILFTH